MILQGFLHGDGAKLWALRAWRGMQDVIRGVELLSGTECAPACRCHVES